MSDTPQGADWFKASDGKWYPPAAPVGAPPPPTPQFANQQKKSGCLKSILIGFGVLIVLIVIGVATSSGSKKSTTTATGASTTTTAATQRLYPGRVDSQPKDHEATIGQAVEFSGYTTSVDSADFQQSVSAMGVEIGKDGYITANITIKNRDSKAQSYSSTNFKLQTPNGQVVDQNYLNYTQADQLQLTGNLVKDGSVSGKVTFTVGSTKGDYYIIYKPDPFDASRGIWKVTVK